MVEKSTPFWVMYWAKPGTSDMGIPVPKLMVGVVLAVEGWLDFNRTPRLTPRTTIKITSPTTRALAEVFQPSFTGCGPWPPISDRFDPHSSQYTASSSFSWPHLVHFTTTNTPLIILFIPD